MFPTGCALCEVEESGLPHLLQDRAFAKLTRLHNGHFINHPQESLFTAPHSINKFAPGCQSSGRFRQRLNQVIEAEPDAPTMMIEHERKHYGQRKENGEYKLIDVAIEGDE
jgi:hypothetical protein